MKKLARQERQIELKNIIEENPFITDEELAKKYDCSVQTIRLDRLLLGIPEVRERMKNVAQENYKKVKIQENMKL
jgi:DeoR/GlpR family transcriptional regulator of sugar metabolism